MKNRTKHNLIVWGIYSLGALLLLLPFDFTWMQSICLSIGLGFTWGLLNDVILQLRMLNGEEFESQKD
jgi:hypothetical protein